MARTCVGCRRTGPKDTFVRIVRSPDGEVTVDVTGSASGRGAYVCPREECFARAAQRGRLARALRTRVDDEAVERMRRAFGVWLEERRSVSEGVQ